MFILYDRYLENAKKQSKKQVNKIVYKKLRTFVIALILISTYCYLTHDYGVEFIFFSLYLVYILYTIIATIRNTDKYIASYLQEFEALYPYIKQIKDVSKSYMWISNKNFITQLPKFDDPLPEFNYNILLNNEIYEGERLLELPKSSELTISMIKKYGHVYTTKVKKFKIKPAYIYLPDYKVKRLRMNRRITVNAYKNFDYAYKNRIYIKFRKVKIKDLTSSD